MGMEMATATGMETAIETVMAMGTVTVTETETETAIPNQDQAQTHHNSKPNSRPHNPNSNAPRSVFLTTHPLG